MSPALIFVFMALSLPYLDEKNIASAFSVISSEKIPEAKTPMSTARTMEYVTTYNCSYPMNLVLQY